MTTEGPLPLLVQRLDPGLPLPAYAHPGDAGADLLAREDVELAPGQRASIPTGVAVAIPHGYAAFVHPRSGLAARLGVTILNGPGTVDAGYRGEIAVTLINTDPKEQVLIRRGDRIAQLVVQRVEQAEFVEVQHLPGSERGAGGHGSTGGFAQSITEPAGSTWPTSPGAPATPTPPTTPPGPTSGSASPAGGGQ